MLLADVGGSSTSGGYGTLMIGVMVQLTSKLVSPRGPSGEIYSVSGSKAGGLDKLGEPRE